jgi:hypothetical protein
VVQHPRKNDEKVERKGRRDEGRSERRRKRCRKRCRRRKRGQLELKKGGEPSSMLERKEGRREGTTSSLPLFDPTVAASLPRCHSAFHLEIGLQTH